MDIKLINKEIGDVLKIEYRASMMKMSQLMKTGLLKIKGFMESNDHEVKEPPFACYYDVDWDGENKIGFLKNMIRAFTKKWHFSVGFPVSKKFDKAAEIQKEKVGTQKYISCTHYGPYKTVGKTYKGMMKYAADEGLKMKDYCYEFYVNDPREVKKNELETLCLIPVE